MLAAKLFGILYVPGHTIEQQLDMLAGHAGSAYAPRGASTTARRAKLTKLVDDLHRRRRMLSFCAAQV